MSAFTDIAASLAGFIHTDVATAGFILGFITLVALVVAMAWLLGESMQGMGALIPAGIAIAFVVMVGWWPLWSLVFIGLILVFVIFNPFGRGSGV